ncbi:MAG: TRAP transporter large permease subunit [Oscillospiraceae bacterium]|nr:TRAP transporter large permease subunit [Oscillospiraceae bacterium]
MSKEMIGVLCLIALLVLIYTGMRVGFCMALIGFVGLLFVTGPDGALSVLALIPWRAICSYTFAAVALFMLTGIIIADAGFGKDLFDCANHWLGNIKGGLSMATAAASAILGFITYSTISNITMGKIAVPEMKKYNYEDGMAAASVCGGASLASIVPPSTGFILYSMLSEVSLGRLYMAALIPAGVLFVLVLISIFLRCRMNPTLAPTSGQTYSLWAKIKSLKMV